MKTDIIEPRYRRFIVKYPSGTLIASQWTLDGGGTLRQVQMEHPMAIVEGDEDSRVNITDAE